MERRQLYKDDNLLGEKRRLVTTVWKVEKDEDFPDGIEFAHQYLYKKEESWIQVARIDNQFHSGLPGTHMHILYRERVQWEHLTPKQAKQRVIEIGESVIRNIIGDVT